MSMVIRAIGTVTLLVGVYTETGPWTTVALALVVVSIEVNSWAFGQLTESVKLIGRRLS